MPRTVTLTEGIGYVEDANGNVKEYFDLGPGEHEFDAGVTVHEVSSRANLPDIAEQHRGGRRNQPEPAEPAEMADYRDAKAAGDVWDALDAIVSMLGHDPDNPP